MDDEPRRTNATVKVNAITDDFRLIFALKSTAQTA